MSRPTPALDLWRQELRDGRRTALDFDDLWRSACAEMTALELEATQLTESAKARRLEAAELLARSLRGGRYAA